MTGKATAKNLLRILLLTTLALLVANLPASAEISQRDQKAIVDAELANHPNPCSKVAG
jgi:hypothetical protein